ncbi:hypothetical protein [Dipodfec virus UOA04_Rod_962]|nr:hypothetical protein [Dipodfec virus UOA04_Rod_962]
MQCVPQFLRLYLILCSLWGDVMVKYENLPIHHIHVRVGGRIISLVHRGDFISFGDLCSFVNEQKKYLSKLPKKLRF